jgi:hypothetical protein
MIEIGERLGLILLYLFVAGCAVLALSLFARALVTLLSGKRQRRGMPEGMRTRRIDLRMPVGKRGWANISLPLNIDSSAEAKPETNSQRRWRCAN